MKILYPIAPLVLLAVLPACADADAAPRVHAQGSSGSIQFGFEPEEFAPGRFLEFEGALSRPLVDPEDGEPVRVIYFSYRMPRSDFATMEVVACDDARSLMGDTGSTEAAQAWKLHPRPGLTWGDVQRRDDVVLEVEPLTPGGD